ncbi:hypothetical protein Pmani_038183 [Petrolisthes manimaculis]|uniref:Uncharacterized protein n=1 Tax=Petrolisthes manimaculis TaxID=1843537 RepID=A0AAE1NGX4_9EUCA|nr:hypothetical protein Pmani_038183 [Petrolisthes manimaculis]
MTDKDNETQQQQQQQQQPSPDNVKKLENKKTTEDNDNENNDMKLENIARGGIALVRSEGNIARLVRDVRGTLMENAQEWRNVVSVLQRYDDQVRRAVEYFHRQNSPTE